MDIPRPFMVKVQHKGEIVGHTFISIDYRASEPDGPFPGIVDRISHALKTPDGSNMPKTPAVSHKIKTVWVDWQGAFGPDQPLTELTKTNIRAVFQYMAGAKHPYNLEVVFEEGEELPPYSSSKKDGILAIPGTEMEKRFYFRAMGEFGDDHTFISILYNESETFDDLMEKFINALISVDLKNMHHDIFDYHQFESLRVNWENLFHSGARKTIVTPQNFKAVFGFMAKHKHPYTLEFMGVPHL